MHSLVFGATSTLVVHVVNRLIEGASRPGWRKCVFAAISLAETHPRMGSARCGV
jgi:hypothetical protein